MKFKTQHIRVWNNGSGYDLHRDGKTTWKTRSGKSGVIAQFDTIIHATVAAAKAELGNITSSSRF